MAVHAAEQGPNDYSITHVTQQRQLSQGKSQRLQDDVFVCKCTGTKYFVSKKAYEQTKNWTGNNKDHNSAQWYFVLKKCKDLGESGGEKGGISQEEKGDEDEGEKNVKCLFHTTCYMKYADFNPFLQRLVPKQNKTKGNIMPNTIM